MAEGEDADSAAGGGGHAFRYLLKLWLLQRQHGDRDSGDGTGADADAADGDAAALLLEEYRTAVTGIEQEMTRRVMATVEGGASAVRGDGIGERLLTYIGAKGSAGSTVVSYP